MASINPHSHVTPKRGEHKGGDHKGRLYSTTKASV